jgi:enoyl-CoA hydratase/carnithine racemase
VAYDYSTVTVELIDGVATCTIANPPINLFDAALYGDMARLAKQLQNDDAVRVVVLQSSTPRFFIAHFDVELLLRYPTRPAATELNDFQLMCERFRTMAKATIAVIEGRAGGGGSELALSFDMRFGAIGSAVFNQPEVALGILPGGSGTVRLPRLIGRSRALEVLLGCDDIDALTAERWGWINRALPSDEIRPFVQRLARRIASFPPGAVAEAKASVLRAETDVPRHLLDEAAGFSRLCVGDEAQQAMTRFLARGGQTVEGELRLGDLAAALSPD